ncbi:MAG TPA: class I SAM-dependent methyltransferase [Vicinamibacterales bacterium]|nr:class I SAM-dependent methyltransferase [Vicinamibacterales bacterium]
MEQTHWAAVLSLESARLGAALDDWAAPVAREGVHPFVQESIGATGGNLYRSLIGRLPKYPIPEMPLEAGHGRTLVDVGCNWGRWTIAAARRGYRPIGIDPSLQALLAARAVCAQLGVDADFVIGDARHLPLRSGSIDTAFSYSVIQHFSKTDAAQAAADVGRVLAPGGTALVQMPNVYGVRCLVQQARRRFRAPQKFEVRYWSPPELRRTFERAIGPTRLSVDGFFSLNAQPAEADILPAHLRALVHTSAALARVANQVPPLVNVADSLWVTSTKSRS